MGVQNGHQERGKTWKVRGATGQLRPLLGSTGQFKGSAGLLQNGGIQVGKGVTVETQPGARVPAGEWVGQHRAWVGI